MVCSIMEDPILLYDTRFAIVRKWKEFKRLFIYSQRAFCVILVIAFRVRMKMFDCVLNHFPPRDAMSEKWKTFLWNLKVFVKYCAAMWIFSSQRWSLLFLAVFLARCRDSHTIPNSALGAAISCSVL
jgi:hypothetical protein